MRVVVQRIRGRVKGRGEELGHDRFYAPSSETFFIPKTECLSYTECYLGFLNGAVEKTFFWVVATTCCTILPEGTVVRVYMNDGREV